MQPQVWLAQNTNKPQVAARNLQVATTGCGSILRPFSGACEISGTIAALPCDYYNSAGRNSDWLWHQHEAIEVLPSTDWHLDNRVRSHSRDRAAHISPRSRSAQGRTGLQMIHLSINRRAVHRDISARNADGLDGGQ